VKAAAQLSAPEVERFRSAVRGRLGLHFDDGRLQVLAEVLGRRIAATGRPAAVYLTQLEGTATAGDEPTALARELTIAETYFFRNVEQFNALRAIVLPARARARSGDRRLNILSAGCASGEEAYSLAICAREQIDLGGYEVSIRGVDVNPAVLERAAAGRYSTWSLRETPDAVRARYFRAEGRDLILAPEIRAAVTFEERNLAEPEPGLWSSETFDLVFCRNVLMYFAPEMARAVLGRIARSLVPGGYLFLGSAETLRGLSQDFRMKHTHETFYYQKASPAEGDVPPDLFSIDPDLPTVAATGDSWVEAIQRSSEHVRSLTDLPTEKDREVTPPNPIGGGLDRAVELIGQERFDDARSALAELAPPAARRPDALLLQAVLLTHGGDLVAAERLCDEVLALDSLSAGAHYLTALCRERAGDARGAADHARAAAQLAPGFALPHLQLGLLARRADDRGTARRELAEALVLLARDDPTRLAMFGGGFGRAGLIALCRAELLAAGGAL
jgi:chemotaxis protein methyltransferase CheR